MGLRCHTCLHLILDLIISSRFSSPRSEESEDSDDLESETSPSPTHNAGTEEEGKDKTERRVNGDGSSLSKKAARDGNLKVRVTSFSFHLIY